MGLGSRPLPQTCGDRPSRGGSSESCSDGTGHTYLHSAGDRGDVGAQPPVQSDVTGDRPVTDRSFLTDLGGGLGAKRREGPRGMTWHPEAPRPLLRFARCGGTATRQDGKND
ncbi:hypothetical protein [Oryza sativa Japonica Group]|uniref:DUF1263 domain-containing protein n=1 Tax=Oryza sativa subsp. japonica TaxID=39947 RepID=Q5ZD51_ORYSJ|nr:hypothetical protein [Oryza sativa Japonica Group]